MINLLPPDIQKEIRFARLNVTAMQYAILIMAVSLSLASLLFFGVAVVSGDEESLHQNIQEKEAILAELEDSVGKAKELEQQIDTISALLEREVSFSSLLRDIGGVIPEGASLTGLSLTGDETLPLRIGATVRNQPLAAVLRENLEDSELFENADIQSITASEVDARGNALFYSVQLVVNFETEEN